MTDDVSPAPEPPVPEPAAPGPAYARDAADLLRRRLEALLMVADEPQSPTDLATGVGRPVAEVRHAIAELVADYDGESGGPRRGFELREVGGGWRLYVRPEHDPLVRDFVLTQNPTRLSQAALETLAVSPTSNPSPAVRWRRSGR